MVEVRVGLFVADIVMVAEGVFVGVMVEVLVAVRVEVAVLVAVGVEVGVFVVVRVAVLVKVEVGVRVGVFVGGVELIPTKEQTLEAGSEKVKLLAATGAAPCLAKDRVPSVIQGVTDMVVRPVKLKVWFTAAPVPLMATITNVVGDEPEVFLKAVTDIPAEGTAVAPIRK